MQQQVFALLRPEIVEKPYLVLPEIGSVLSASPGQILFERNILIDHPKLEFNESKLIWKFNARKRAWRCLKDSKINQIGAEVSYLYVELELVDFS